MDIMKKFLAVILTLSLMLSVFSLTVFATTSAYFGSNDYCSVTISQSLMNSSKYKTASVKITTYDLTGRKSSGKVVITLKDNYGNYIGTYRKTSGDTIKLGNDHSGYRIYIFAYHELVKGGMVSSRANKKTTFIGVSKKSKFPTKERSVS
jgi:uncharacterized protein YxeA